MIASHNGHTKVVKILHEYGAQVNMQDNNGMSALMAANIHGHTEVVKLLHEYGVQVDLQDSDGSTALMLACQNSHIQSIEVLLKHGAQIDSNFVSKLSASGSTNVVDILNKQIGKILLYVH